MERKLEEMRGCKENAKSTTATDSESANNMKNIPDNCKYDHVAAERNKVVTRIEKEQKHAEEGKPKRMRCARRLTSWKGSF